MNGFMNGFMNGVFARDTTGPSPPCSTTAREAATHSHKRGHTSCDTCTCAFTTRQHWQCHSWMEFHPMAANQHFLSCATVPNTLLSKVKSSPPRAISISMYTLSSSLNVRTWCRVTSHTVSHAVSESQVTVAVAVGEHEAGQIGSSS